MLLAGAKLTMLEYPSWFPKMVASEWFLADIKVFWAVSRWPECKKKTVIFWSVDIARISHSVHVVCCLRLFYRPPVKNCVSSLT